MLDEKMLAEMLKGYNIFPRYDKDGTEYYAKEQFLDAWFKEGIISYEEYKAERLKAQASLPSQKQEEQHLAAIANYQRNNVEPVKIVEF